LCQDPCLGAKKERKLRKTGSEKDGKLAPVQGVGKGISESRSRRMVRKGGKEGSPRCGERTGCNMESQKTGE